MESSKYKGIPGDLLYTKEQVEDFLKKQRELSVKEAKIKLHILTGINITQDNFEIDSNSILNNKLIIRNE